MHQSGQTLERPAWLRISPDYRWRGRLPLSGADCFVEGSLDLWTKGGRPPVRRYISASGPCSLPRGRAHCRYAASPSPCAGVGLGVRPLQWHSCLARCHAGPGTVRGCEDEGRSGPVGADRLASGPNVRSQRVTPVLTEPPSEKAAIWVRRAPKQGPKPPLSNWTRFSSNDSPTVSFYGVAPSPRPPHR